MASSGGDVRLRFRQLASFIGERDTAEQACRQAEVEARRLSSSKELHTAMAELLAGIEDAAAPGERRLRLRAASSAMRLKGSSYATSATVGLCVRHAAVLLGREKNEGAISELASLVAASTIAVLALAQSEGEAGEPLAVNRLVIKPLLKAGVGCVARRSSLSRQRAVCTGAIRA